MNKKFLGAVLFGSLLAGSSMTFTGCIDTDEPAGIENLRGAKAELIRAKVAVEAANAAYVNAEAALKLAEAETEKAEARYQNALAAIEEARAEQEAARTEEEIARIEAQIAEYEKQIQETALELQISLAQKQQALAEAEFALESALTKIEIAQATGALNLENATLEFWVNLVKNIHGKIYGDNGLGGLIDEVYQAEKKLYNAMLDKAAGQGENGYIPELELAVERAEAEVEAAEFAKATLEEFLENDVETTDWRAEIAELEDSVDALEYAISEKEIEVEKALNSEEYLAAFQKIYGIGTEKGTEQLLADAIGAHDKYADETELKVSAINLPVNEQLKAVVDKGIVDYNNGLKADQVKSPALTWNASVKGFYIGETKYNHPEFDFEGEDATEEDLVLAQVNAFIGALDKASVNLESIEWAEYQKADKEKAVLKADTAYQEALALWNIAINAMGGQATAIPAAEQAKVTAAITAYNAAVTNLEAKVAAYNTARQTVYTAAYDAYVTEQYNKEYWNEFKAKTASSLPTNPNVKPLSASISDIITSIETLNTTDAARIAALEAYYVVDSNIVDNPATTDVNEATVAANAVAKLLADNKAQAKKVADVAQINADGWATFANEKGKAAVSADKDKAIENADKAVKTAAEGIQKDAKTGKYPAMTAAWAEYKALAADMYAQVQTTAAKEVALPTLPALMTDNKTTADDYGFYPLECKVAKMDETKVATMMTLELDQTLAETALLNTSNKAFGLGGTQGRLTLPTDEEVLKGALNNDTDPTNNGAKYTLLKAQEALNTLNDQLAQTDNLAALKVAAAAAKTALVAEIAANDKLFEEYGKAIVDAYVANEAAIDALEAIEYTLAGKIYTEVAKLKAKKGATENVLSVLVLAVNQHLGLDGVAYDFEDFEKDLQDAVEDAEDAIIAAEKALLAAEKDLQLAEEGKYDAVAVAQRELDAANGRLEQMLESYELAMENLEKVLAIMAGEEAEEDAE